MQPIIESKRFDIFPLTGGCSEGLDGFRFFLEIYIITGFLLCYPFGSCFIIISYICNSRRGVRDRTASGSGIYTVFLGVENLSKRTERITNNVDVFNIIQKYKTPVFTRK